ncbi:G-protein coupled receptor 64 [Stegastes partitus]|uniref:Adhesion G-protein coupled receptor G2 n=1 Tax=Stegastes partitus TaxID=144197 RepID=A0A3B5BNG4_9TELE|nr:PREDICTED: G-protein coupled receptor 64-like [Stegastes partitus]
MTSQSTSATTAATTSQSTSATTAATTSQSTSGTTAATTTSQSTSGTTAATTSQSTSATTAATTTSQSTSVTNTATTTLRTPIANTVTLVINSPAAFPPDSSVTPLRPVRPPPNTNNPRVIREVSGTVTQSSEISNRRIADLYQGIEVSCNIKTAIRNTTCTVTLSLSRRVPPCCILRVLCAASKNSTDIHVVGNRIDRINQFRNECNINPEEANSCVYHGQTNTSCIESEDAYVVPHSNSTTCGAGNRNCSCSAYCNGSDAYYTFQISTRDPNMNSSYVSSVISEVKQPPPCLSIEDFSCPVPIIASEYKNVSVACRMIAESVQSCRVILRFAREVPICAVATAVKNVLQSERQILFDGRVIRAALCGNLEAGNDPLQSQFTGSLVAINLTPAHFCTAIEESNVLSCQSGKNVLVLLRERCVVPVGFTTISPNVTTIQPNSTTLSANTTSSPMNTTTAQQNTTEALNTTTTAANVTLTTTLNSTTSTTNDSTSVTPSETPTTTETDAEGQANALLELTRNVSQLNSSQVDQLVSQLEGLLSGPNVSLGLGNTSVNIVSNLLDATPETLSSSSNRIIGIVDTVGLKLVIGENAETLLSPSVALSVNPADGANFQETVFSISDPTNVQVGGATNLRRKRSVRTDSSIPQGSIRLPPSLTQNLTSEEQQLISRVQFNFYQRSTVFQDQSLGDRRLNSGILGASVANLTITGLQENVTIRLRNTEPIPANFVATCVFWDFTFNNNSGGWNSDGCFVQNSTDNETVCGCNHLTSFAILLDLSRQPLTSRVQATILTFITYIGCGVSAIFLSVTLLTYLAFGKLRKDIPSKILIQLCLALLLLNLVFLVDAWLALYPDSVGLCISTAWFLHYFLLVAFTWMGLEAVHMYLALVKVFNSYISRYMLKFSLVGWGVPMIVVIIVIAIDKDNYGLVSYGRFTDGTTDEFCWLKNDIAFYVAVVAYFCVIFLFNFVMFIVVLVQLCRIKRQNPHNVQHRTTLQDVRSMAGITILLGLTWGFAFFAWGPVNLAFMYLFAIFNSLQGFFIFVFHCAVKESVRRQWRTYLCCGKMRLAENSEWSRTATQKTVKKSSLTKLTSLHSSNSSNSNNYNNSTSSSTFLVSESSEPSHGVVSPFDDRVITGDEDPSMDVILNEINSQYRNPQPS